jgi:hypothetical protein
VRRDLPAALDPVVLSALAPASADRPGDAEAWLADVVAASGTRPDPGVLARIAREVTQAEIPSERTEMPDSAPIPRLEAPRRGGSQPIPWLAVAGLAGIGLAAAVWAAIPPDEPALMPPVPAPQASLAPDSVAAPLFRAEPAPAFASRRDLAAAVFRAVANEVRFAFSGEGPLHVSGEGVSGLAPLRTGPMGDGPHVFRIQGRAGASAVLRLVVSGEKVTASLGAPEGRFYEVECAGRNLGTTPAVGIRVTGVLPCRLSGPDGGLAFVITVVRT